jgi:predicted permease
MRTLRGWLMRVGGLFGTSRDRELAQEIESHLQLHIDDNQRLGLTAAEARRRALLTFGGIEAAKEAYRDRRGVPAVETLVRDVRYGLRLLRRSPGFAAVAVVSLALGIGANTAVFSLINAIVLKPLPGHPDGVLVGLYSKDRTHPGTYRAFSYPNYADVRAHTDLFASLAAHSIALVGLTEGDHTRQVLVDIATANFFDTFGVSLESGRSFTPQEEQPGADLPVAILSDAAYQRMGGSADILGRSIRLNGRPYTVVGVAPKAFGGSMAMLSPECWVPTGVYDSLENDFLREGAPGTLSERRHHSLILVARLRPGAALASVTPGLEAIGTQLERAFPAENRDQVLLATPLARMSISTEPQTDRELAVVTAPLLAMSAVVLLVASLNLANILLARGRSRQKEFAIRSALGGSRTRLVRQLLTEGFVLSLVGGTAGLFVGSWATRLLISSLSTLIPMSISFDTAPDVRVVAATFGFSMLSAIVFGLGPSWKLARTDAVPELKSQAGEPPPRRSRLNGGAAQLLVMGQLALTLALVAAAGLFVRSAMQAANSDPGFTFDRGVLIHVDPSLAGNDTPRTRAVYSRILDRLRARPDVSAVSFGSVMPFGERSMGRSVQKAGAPINSADPAAAAGLVSAQAATIGTDYFNALGLRVLRGRDFTSSEETSAGSRRVAIIDEPLARRLFGDADPVGREVQYSMGPADPTPTALEVVGLVPGLRHRLFDRAPVPHIYTPYGQDPQTDMYLHVRTAAMSAQAEAALLPGLRHELLGVDPNLPILSLETRAMFRERSFMLALLRALMGILTVFGLVALALAAAGVYGVKAYLVSRRTREIGIRVALGATRADVVWMVMRDGLTSMAIGLTVGAGLAVVAGVALSTLSFQGRGADPAIVGGALLVLICSALLATWLPARRATRIAPTRALRTE